MKYSDYVKTYEYFSGKTSDVTRTLAFSGIAIIWIFKVNTAMPQVPSGLLPPLLFLAVSLASDLLQYLSGTISWGYYVYVAVNPRKGSESDPDLYPSHWWELPIHIFFVLKLVAIILGYGFLIRFALKVWLQG